MNDLDLILVITTILLGIGIYGLSTKRDALRMLMSIEILINAAALNFIAFAHFYALNVAVSHVFVLFIISIAAAEAGIGIAIFLALYRIYKGPEIDIVSKVREE